MYPGTPDIIVLNLSVALRPIERDLERFEIAASGILMVTHSEIILNALIYGREILHYQRYSHTSQTLKDL